MGRIRAYKGFEFKEFISKPQCDAILIWLGNADSHYHVNFLHPYSTPNDAFVIKQVSLESTGRQIKIRLYEIGGWEYTNYTLNDIHPEDFQEVVRPLLYELWENTHKTQ